MNSPTNVIIAEKASALLVRLTTDGSVPSDAATIRKIAEDELLSDTDRAFLFAYAAQVQPVIVTEADIHAYLRDRAAKILARATVARSASVAIRAGTDSPPGGHYDVTVHIIGSGFCFCEFGPDIDSAAGKVLRNVDTPETLLAKRREELAQAQADIAAIEAQFKPSMEAA